MEEIAHGDVLTRLISKLIIITFICDPIETSRDPHTYQRERNHAISFQQTAFGRKHICDPFVQNFDEAFCWNDSFPSR